MREPWGVRETNMIIQGIRKFGRCPKQLCEFVKTRNACQVTNKLNEMTKQALDPKHFMFEDVRQILLATKSKRTVWTDEEHHFFLDQLKHNGKNFKKIAQNLGTKTKQQVTSHCRYLAE